MTKLMYTNHNDDRGVWCQFSMVSAPAYAKPEDQCPVECRESRVIEDPRPVDPMDEDEVEALPCVDAEGVTAFLYLHKDEAMRVALHFDEVDVEAHPTWAEGVPVKVDVGGTIVYEIDETGHEVHHVTAQAGLPLSAEIAYLEWQFQERQISTRMGWMSEVMGLLASWREAGRV